MHGAMKQIFINLLFLSRLMVSSWILPCQQFSTLPDKWMHIGRTSIAVERLMQGKCSDITVSFIEWSFDFLHYWFFCKNKLKFYIKHTSTDCSWAESRRVQQRILICCFSIVPSSWRSQWMHYISSVSTLTCVLNITTFLLWINNRLKQSFA